MRARAGIERASVVGQGPSSSVCLLIHSIVSYRPGAYLATPPSMRTVRAVGAGARYYRAGPRWDLEQRRHAPPWEDSLHPTHAYRATRIFRWAWLRRRVRCYGVLWQLAEVGPIILTSLRNPVLRQPSSEPPSPTSGAGSRCESVAGATTRARPAGARGSHEPGEAAGEASAGRVRWRPGERQAGPC
jgi:hypothetical protein